VLSVSTTKQRQLPINPQGHMTQFYRKKVIINFKLKNFFDLLNWWLIKTFFCTFFDIFFLLNFWCFINVLGVSNNCFGFLNWFSKFRINFCGFRFEKHSNFQGFLKTIQLFSDFWKLFKFLVIFKNHSNSIEILKKLKFSVIFENHSNSIEISKKIKIFSGFQKPFKFNRNFEKN
jgi:hypothetical protein